MKFRLTIVTLATLAITLPSPVSAQSSSTDRGGSDRQSERNRQDERGRRQDGRGSRDQDRSQTFRNRRSSEQEQRSSSRTASSQARTQYMAGLAAGYMIGYADGLDDYVIVVPQRRGSQARGQASDSSDQGMRDRLRERARDRIGRQRDSRFRADRVADSPRQQQSQSQQFTGEIRSIKKVRLQNDNQQHTVLLVKNDQGRKRIVDAGPSDQLRKLDLQQGDQITVSGRALRTKDSVSVLNARRIESEGQSVAIRGGQQGQQSRR